MDGRCDLSVFLTASQQADRFAQRARFFRQSPH